MKLLSVSNLSKSFETPLFSGVTFAVNSSSRIGLVGPNGAGKSTLFKILINEMPSSDGDFFVSKHVKIGYMAQHIDIDGDNSVYTEACRVFAHLSNISAELIQIHNTIDQGHGDLNVLVKRQSQLSERFEAEGGLTYESRTRAMLLGLGFSKQELEKKTVLLSGGEKTKVSLAKMLLSDADLLLLDEPTNHLDIPSVEWLENFLNNSNKAYIVISHDRRFLDNVTSQTLDLSHGQLKVYEGGYTEHLKQKALDDAQTERNNKNIQREIDRINSIIKQQKKWHRERNIRTAKSKQHEVDRLKARLTASAQTDRSLFIRFNTDKLGGQEVVAAESLSKTFKEQVLFEDLNFLIRRGERVFLLGANGSGKTTLFKILEGKLSSDSGTVKRGIHVDPAYFDQTQQNLINSKTVFEMVHDSYPDMTETEIRTTLGAFQFIGEDVFKPISDLSGGERSRLSLMLLMLSRANFLLLDEPTNHLDILSKEALQHALGEYLGTLFIISHDRYLINEMSDRILYLDKQSVTEYIGNYDDFLLKREAEQPPSEDPVTKPSFNDYQQKKQRQSQINRLNGKISRLENEILTEEQAVSQLEHEMATPEIAADYTRAAELASDTESLKISLNGKYDKLHELEAELEAIKKEDG